MTFDDISGHLPQIEMLRNELRNRRLAHAYLFEGPDGIGKRQVAEALAAAYLCELGTGCGSCSSCRKTAVAGHPDLLMLNTEGHAIKIDQIRALQQQLALRPFEATGKICLINDADLLTVEAGNALLKTLEEPKPGIIIILISSRPEAMLSTILSRCRRVPFQRLSKAEMAQLLRQQLDLDDTRIAVLAAVADGSLKKVLGSNQELYLKIRPQLIQSLSALSATSTIQAFDFAETLKSEKDQISAVLDIFAMFFRDTLLYQMGRTTAEIVNQDLIEIVAQQSNRFSSRQIIKKLEAVATTRRYLDRNVNLHLALDHLLLSISRA